MLIWLAIGAVVFVVLMFIIPNLLGRGGREIGDFFSSTKDYDRDGTANYFDKCPCDKGDYDGCPTEEGYTDEEMKSCKYEIEGD